MEECFNIWIFEILKRLNQYIWWLCLHDYEILEICFWLNPDLFLVHILNIKCLNVETCTWRNVSLIECLNILDLYANSFILLCLVIISVKDSIIWNILLQTYVFITQYSNSLLADHCTVLVTSHRHLTVKFNFSIIRLLIVFTGTQMSSFLHSTYTYF